MEYGVIIDLNDMPLSTAEAHELKSALIDGVESQGVGEVTGSGMGLGMIDFDIEMAESTSAQHKLRTILRSLELEERTTVSRLPR